MTQQLVLAITGGGTQIIPILFGRPGASAMLLEASVPYHPSALENYLGSTVEKASSEATARQMAVAAYQRGLGLLGKQSPKEPVGVACTAALATNRQRRGNDRAFIALHSSKRTLSVSIDFGNNHSQRETQEHRTAQRIHQSLARFGIANLPEIQLRSPFVDKEIVDKEIAATERDLPENRTLESCVTLDCQAPGCWQALVDGRMTALEPAKSPLHPPATALDPEKHFRVSQDPYWQTHVETPVATNQLIFPGSFNPPHAGHLQMAAYAAEQLGQAVKFELAITNADKPPLDYLSIRERVELLENCGASYLLTRTPRFFEKAELFPNSVFIIGADTAVRIADPKFYDGRPDRRDAALEHLNRLGCRFMTFGRISERGFLAAEQLDLPPLMKRLCICVPELKFRNDLSSTQLRKSAT